MKNNVIHRRGIEGMTAKLVAGIVLAILGTSASAAWLFSANNRSLVVNPTKDTMVIGAPTGTSFVDIASAGPLIHLYLGNELSCQVAHISDGTTLEFYPPDTIPGDSGTFIAMNGTLYTPDFGGHGRTATGSLGSRVLFVPISQTGVTGAGTASNPFKVVTVVDVGTTGLRIQQTDTYIVGDEAYRTDTMLINSGGPASGVLYRAGDAFLAGSDFGYGFTEVFGNRNAVGCSVNANNVPPNKIEEWIPLTGGNNFYQNFYGAGGVWSWIGTKAPFPNTCDCTIFQDNAAGISWNFSIPAGGSATFSHVTTFSPQGRQSLLTFKTADNATSITGSQNGYTITIQNPNPAPVTLSSIKDTLPPRFTYLSGSTSGGTTNNPAASGQVLTWSGPFVVASNSSVSLHFAVTVASIPGSYLNEAGGETAGGYTVTGTGPTARITVVPSQLANVSTRLRVETGDNVLIGGFIVITGTQPKRVILRGIGPSLASVGVPGALANPTLELYNSSGLLASNDDWMAAPNRQEIIDSTLAPTNALESAILMTLPANNAAYTAIVRGVNNGTGVGLVEAYDLDLGAESRLANISTRGLVQTGDNVMIGGFIIVGQSSTRVIVRAIGPSLSVPSPLADPALEFRDENGALLQANDNWRTDGQEADIIATGLQPSNDRESAIIRTLPPGHYTAIVRGVDNGTGIGLVEAYDLGAP